MSGVFELNDLLAKAGIRPDEVLVMRHRPTERELRKVLPWLAAERHSVFNAYQQNHGPVVEKALSRARYLASFIGHEAGRAVFVGLYGVAGSKTVSTRDFWKIPGNAELRSLGTRGPQERDHSQWFDLVQTDVMSVWKGRLVVQWPGIERSWWRWSDRNRIPVHAIHEESLLVPPMPDWQSLVIDWSQLPLVPASWRVMLSQWRGVYLIFDRASGKRYVGSAAGGENLLGRWLNYADSGHGGNRLLRGLDPTNFVFSILQRVSPDTEMPDVVAVESSWKERLHTRAPNGLNDN
ncbi:GIY-YIG nuclease family protein [Pseudoxanthomonas sp. PXM01]|uniref:GIY-YIG nuclease family protein n=1 Tax=Pseudoxanthomonas sp. PXM01 TaxID=2769295 RepID=UPI00177DD183|nr:GIY-YIG nuclease family protein [Pseudoxanthomonas sp. PXM01]MBD9469487.1 GIY-YIG nuclease family protein [Pseudoxanthomonas sp. PXM01]